MSEGTARKIVAEAIWDATPTIVRFDEAQEWRKQEAFRQADAVLASLREAGALAPAGLTVWAVNQVYAPEVGHGYEPVAFFSTEAKAQAYRDHCEVRQAEDFRKFAEYYKTSTWHEYEFTVEEWAVDDAEPVAPAADAATGAPP